MKIAVVTSLISRRAGGLHTSVRRHIQSVASKTNHSIKVFSCRDEFSDHDSDLWKPLDLVLTPFYGPTNYTFSPRMIQELLDYKPDLIHLQGIWTWASLSSLVVAKKLKIPLIITPRGMADQWALGNSKFKKKLIMALYERKLFNYASAWQALNFEERESILKISKDYNITVIQNGIDVVEKTIVYPRPKRLLFISRLHKKKGVHLLVEAWARTPVASRNGWKLTIAGWGDASTISELEQRVNLVNSNNDIELISSGVFGDDKSKLLIESAAFILPSFSEGLPMSVLEAWAYKLPVLMSKECNLPVGFENFAAFQTQPAIESIEQGLLWLFGQSDSDLASMGERGYNLVCKSYSWNYLSEDLLALYDDVYSTWNSKL